MADPYCLLFVHCIWSTWQRMPLITPEIEKGVYDSIVVKCRELKSKPIVLGGTEDHIHLLVQIAPVISVAKLVQELKGASSHLVTHQLAPGAFFRWQGGYGALTVDE
ncbi:MAG TPA: IS200/IS605 family transposase, partial [Chloroflexia bacterium]|nr:IS200/IS605 family transposase [Chloroflexia bacterium]